MTDTSASSASNSSRVARNAGILIARQLVVTAVGVIAAAMIARHLGPRGYGRFEYVFALVLGVGTVANFGLRAITVRTVAQESVPLKSFVSTTLTLRLVLALGAWPLCIALGYYLGDVSLALLVAIAAAALPINAVSTTLRDTLQGLERFDVEAATAVAVRVTTFAGALAVIVLDGELIAIVSVYAAGAVVGLVIPVRALLRAGYRFGLRWSGAAARRELRAALPFAGNAFVALLMWEVNPLLIEGLGSMAMVGLFAAGIRLLVPLEMIPQSVSDALTPAVARAWTRRADQALDALLRKSIYGLLAIGVPVAVGGALLADGLIELLFGSQYGAAASVFRILVVVLPLEFFSIPAFDALGAMHRQNRLFWITCGGAAVNLSMAALLIPIYGAVGCAWAGAATAVYFAAALLWVLRRYCRPWRDLKAYGKLAAASAMMAGAVIAVRPLGVIPAVLAGIFVYGSAAFAFDVITKSMLRDFIRPRTKDRTHRGSE